MGGLRGTRDPRPALSQDMPPASIPGSLLCPPCCSEWEIPEPRLALGRCLPRWGHPDPRAQGPHSPPWEPEACCSPFAPCSHHPPGTSAARCAAFLSFWPLGARPLPRASASSHNTQAPQDRRHLQVQPLLDSSAEGSPTGHPHQRHHPSRLTQQERAFLSLELLQHKRDRYLVKTLQRGLKHHKVPCERPCRGHWALPTPAPHIY